MELIYLLLAAGVAVFSYAKYREKKAIEAMRMNFETYPVGSPIVFYVKNSEIRHDVFFLQIDREGKLETVAVFAPTIEIAKRFPLTPYYDFFIREPKTEGIDLPLYFPAERYQIGDPYVMRRDRHSGGLMLPKGYDHTRDKFYYDCENFAAVKEHK